VTAHETQICKIPTLHITIKQILMKFLCHITSWKIYNLLKTRVYFAMKNLVFWAGIPVFHHSNCDLPARALQWQAGQSELT